MDYISLPIHSSVMHLPSVKIDVSQKNKIVALKELSIRADFSTTVEHLIKLLEFDAFKENTITTGWLDSLISSKLTAERPDAALAVVCGAVTKAYPPSNACWTEYRCALEKGQVPGCDALKTVLGVDFIHKAPVTLLPLLDQQFGPSLSTAAGQWLVHGHLRMAVCSCSLTAKVTPSTGVEAGALRFQNFPDTSLCFGWSTPKPV